jgi:hypothetical protein
VISAIAGRARFSRIAIVIVYNLEPWLRSRLPKHRRCSIDPAMASTLGEFQVRALIAVDTSFGSSAVILRRVRGTTLPF